MTFDIYAYASRTCKFRGQHTKTNRYGYCGKCWSQLERIESDGDILICLDKSLGGHAHKMIDAIEEMVSQGTHPKEVPKAVVHEINNLKPKLRYTLGKNVEKLIEASRNLSEEDFYRTIAQSVLKKRRTAT